MPTLGHGQAAGFAQAIHGAELRLAGERQRIQAIGLIEGRMLAARGPGLRHGFLVARPIAEHAGRDLITLLLRLQQEVSGVVRRPAVVRLISGRGREASRPIGKAAVGHLEATQAIDTGLHVVFHFLLFVVAEFHQRRQIDLRKGRRRGLLDTTVRIAYEILQTAFQIERRHRRDLHAHHVGARQTMRQHLRLPGLARLERLALILAGGRVRAADVDIDLAARLVFARCRNETQPRLTEGRAHLQAQQAELFFRAREVDLDGVAADDLEVLVSLDLEIHVADVLVHDKQGYRHRQLLVRTEHARHGGEQHERLAHVHRFVNGAIGAILSGDHHDAYRAHIRRQF